MKSAETDFTMSATIVNGDHVVVEALCLSYERWGQTVNALDGVSLSVPHGQWLILVGHNGSGKTSLLRVLSGRAAPDSGQANINGQAAGGMNARELAKTVFLIHQDPLLGTAPDLTVFENLAVADSQAVSESKRSLHIKYGAMLHPLGLADRMKQPAQTLSGGERQLLALLIARLRPASLILLDEPLAALDPSKAERCLAEIADLRKAGKTIIQVTHDPELASTLGDRTVVMRAGKVVHDANSQERNAQTLRNHWF
jgi:putative ABC transport system ATP-binding protein